MQTQFERSLRYWAAIVYSDRQLRRQRGERVFSLGQVDSQLFGLGAWATSEDGIAALTGYLEGDPEILRIVGDVRKAFK